MKFKYRFPLIIAVLLSIISCETQKKEQAPIPFEQMQSILLDMHIAEYKSQGTGAKEGTFLKDDDSLAYYYASIIDNYKLDTVVFREAIDWYMMQPVLFDSIYKGIVIQLEATIDTLKTQEEKLNNPNDSTRMEQVLENLKSNNTPPPFKNKNNENEE